MITTVSLHRYNQYIGLTRQQLTEILLNNGFDSIRDKQSFRYAWMAAGEPPQILQHIPFWQPVRGSRVSGYVPPDRSPFLPFNARSGWELLVRLEQYGCRIRNSDVLPEDVLIEKCLTFLDSERIERMIE